MGNVETGRYSSIFCGVDYIFSVKLWEKPGDRKFTIRFAIQTLASKILSLYEESDFARTNMTVTPVWWLEMISSSKFSWISWTRPRWSQIQHLTEDHSTECWRIMVLRFTGRLNCLEICMSEIFTLELRCMVLLMVLLRDAWFCVVGLGRIYISKFCRSLALLCSHDR
jgi:hypothetical protein